MVEKSETKILIIFTICIILGSIGISGCIGDDKIKNRYFEFEYDINLIYDNTEKYVINLPIFVNKSKIPLKINNEIKLISGNANFSIQNTEFGPSLNIISNQTLEFHLKKRYNYEKEISNDYVMFSLKVSDDIKSSDYHKYRIFFNSKSNDSIFLNIKKEVKEYYDGNNIGKSIFSISDELHNGWQIINATFDSVVA